MKFASLLKQHSNSKATEYVRPITINCNKKAQTINLASQNEYDVDDSQHYQHNQNGNQFVDYSRNTPKNRPSSSNSPNNICLHQIYEIYQSDKNTQWMIEITQLGLVNVRKFKPTKPKSKANVLTQGKNNHHHIDKPISQQQTKPVSQQQTDKINSQQNFYAQMSKVHMIQQYENNSQYHKNGYQSKFANDNRVNYSPMKRIAKANIIDHKNKVLQIGVNLNKFSFGDDESSRKQSVVNFQNYLNDQYGQDDEYLSNREKNKEKEELGTNLLDKFNTCEQNLTKKIKEEQKLQESIQFALQKNVQFSFQQNGKGSKNNNNQSKEQFILNTVTAQKNQIKELDQYVLNQLKPQETKYQIKVVESQFHISSQSKCQRQQQFGTDKKLPLQYFIREQAKFTINKSEQTNEFKTQNRSNKGQNQLISKNFQLIGEKGQKTNKFALGSIGNNNCDIAVRQNLFYNKAVPNPCLNALNEQKGTQKQVYNYQDYQNRQERCQSVNRIYCRANIKTLTPQKFKLQRVDEFLKDKENNKQKQNEQQLTKISNKMIADNIPDIAKTENTYKYNKNYQQQKSKSLVKKFPQFLLNKKASQNQNDRVMRIVLHNPKAELYKQAQVTKQINLKDYSQINKQNNIQKQTYLLKNIDCDRAETPTPSTNFQQYNGGISPKSKPKIGAIMATNLNLKPLKQINTNFNAHASNYKDNLQINAKTQHPLSATINNQLNPKQNNSNQNNKIDNCTNQFVTNTQTINHYSSNKSVSPNHPQTNTNHAQPNPTQTNTNHTQTNNAVNAPSNTPIVANYSTYVPSNLQGFQSKPLSVAPLSNFPSSLNITNAKPGLVSGQFTSTFSPKHYVPYYNIPKQNNKIGSTSQIRNLSKPKVYNQLAGLEIQGQTIIKQTRPNQETTNVYPVYNLNANNLNQCKANTNYQYNSPLTAPNSNNLAYTAVNQNNLKRQEEIVVSPLGEYNRINAPQIKNQINSGANTNQTFVNNNAYPQVPSSNFNRNGTTGLFNDSKMDNNLMPKIDKNDYLKIDYVYRGPQKRTNTVTNITNTATNITNNGFQVNSNSKPTSSPSFNCVPLSSPRNLPYQNNLLSQTQLIQGAKPAQSKVYQMKQGSSNSDINFSVESYN